MRTGYQLNLFTGRILLIVIMLWLCGLPVLASSTPLPIGLPREDAISWILLRSISLVGGLFFLFLGSRFHRFLFSVYFLLLAVAVLFTRLAPFSYIIALGSILVLFLLLSAIHAAWPRLTTGLATIWILPALYIYLMMDTGSFDWSRLILFGSAVFGLVFGLAFPRVSRIPVSVAIGIVLLVLSAPIDLSFFSVMAAATGGILVQSVDFFVVRGVHREWMDTWTQRKEKWKSGFRAVFLPGFLVTGVLSVLVLSATPLISVDQLDSIHVERARAALARSGTVRPGLLISAEDVFYVSGHSWPLALIGEGSGFGARIAVLVRGRHSGREIREARARKDSTELTAMREAARITSLAMAQVGEMVGPGIGEKEIAERIESVFRQEGAGAFAFGSVVGSGPNACLPHYQRNNATLESGFVVVDIGCMVDGYCSDMTRTFPVHRTFSSTQHELAELVLKAKETAQSMLKPGADYREVDRAVRTVFREAGLDAYYLHSVGHHIGISVHDPMVRKLESGMVITIEPGLYIPKGAPIEPRYWDLGIRIEDTVLITETGYESLTTYDQLPFLKKIGGVSGEQEAGTGTHAGETYD